MSDTTTLRALTLHRPWPKAFTHYGKDCENRSWKPPEWLLGRFFALHAGQAWDAKGAAWMQALGMEVDRNSATGIFGVCRLLGVVDRTTLTGDNAVVKMHAFNAVMGPGSCVKTATNSKWVMTGRVWVVGRVHALQESIDVGGAQRLWKVSREHELEIRRQLPGVLDR